MNPTLSLLSAILLLPNWRFNYDITVEMFQEKVNSLERIIVGQTCLLLQTESILINI